MTEWVYSYDELDEILRGDGRAGFVGISAIDGLIAAVVAGPAALQPMEWLPLIFGGRMPAAPPGSPNQRVVNTIIKRHAEVTEILASHPADCPACGGRHYALIKTRLLFQCRGCRHQASLTAGTIFRHYVDGVIGRRY